LATISICGLTVSAATALHQNHEGMNICCWLFSGWGLVVYAQASMVHQVLDQGASFPPGFHSGGSLIHFIKQACTKRCSLMFHGARFRGGMHDETNVSRQSWPLAFFNPDDLKFSLLRYSFRV
jgi:hypothetical protein